MNALALQVRGPQFERGSNALARGLTIGAALDEGEQRRMQMEAARRGVAETDALNAAYTGALGADGQVDRTKLVTGVTQAGYGSKVPLLQKTFAEQDKASADLQKSKGEVIEQRFKQWAGSARHVRTPEQAVGYMNAQYDDPIVGPIISKIETREQALAGLPKDPAAMANWALQTEAGIAKFAENQRQLEQQAETGRSNRAREAGTIRGQDLQAETTRRGQNMVDGRAREGLEVQRQSARTEVKDTADGFVMIDKGTGKVTPLMGADGKALGPKLKDAPPGVQAAVLGNAQNLARAQRALTLVEGLDIGDPAKGGQQGDKAATGWKGYLPNQLLNRVDPQGVDARAAIADLGSLIIHDRSGAAVTAAEFPRLAPFIPTDRDDAGAVKKKLQRFVQVYREELAASEAAYNPGTGFKPPGGARPATPPAGGNGGATVSNW